MSRIHIYADESGNFDFSLRQGATRHFILTTVTFFDDRQACADLHNLKYDLAWEGSGHAGPFHATEDEQAVRDRVFQLLQPHGFRVDAIVIDKRKAMPHLQRDDQLYEFAWYYLLRFLIPSTETHDQETLIVAASVGTKKRRGLLHRGLAGVVNRLATQADIRTTHWPADSDPGLQIADYCSWAFFRKWETGDLRSWALIQDKVHSEFEIFRRSAKLYY